MNVEKQVIGNKVSKNPSGIFVPKTSSRARCFSNFPLGKKKKGINFILAVMIVLVILKIALLLGEYNNPKKEDLGLAVKLNLEGDFPNPEEGSAIFDIKLLMDRIISVHQKVPKYVVFVESKVIPGLIFRYNVHDSVFEGGLPLIRSTEVVFLDGNNHNIVYTFKRGSDQKVYFDGKEIASGRFDPSKIGITGFVVSDIRGYETITIPIDGTVEILDKAR